MGIRRAYQSGVMLIEALIGILIFSLGILAMVGLQTMTVSAVADAQYRVEAVNVANELLSQIWVNLNRTSEATLANDLIAFAHQPDNDPATCSFGGSPSANPIVTSWAAAVSSRLPGSTATRQQVVVDTGFNNRVTITVCWQAPHEATPHRHTLVANVN